MPVRFKSSSCARSTDDSYEQRQYWIKKKNYECACNIIFFEPWDDVKSYSILYSWLLNYNVALRNMYIDIHGLKLYLGFSSN